MGPHLRGAGEREDISCVEVAQRELERPTPGVNLRVWSKDLDDVSVSTRLDVEATGGFSVFALLPQRGIFTMRIEDHARHPVFHQLLDQHAGDVGLAASRFRQNRHVLLDHRVDVEVHRHIVAREETDVRAVLLVLLKPDHLLNRGGLGLVHGLARPKRGARDLQEAAIISVADYADLGRDPLFDVNRIPIPKQLYSVERHVDLPFDFVDAAQDLTARLVGDLDELISFDRIDDGTAESRRPDITINDADKSVAMV